ncbi:MAG: hypothetical protein AAFR16_01595 [Pseudomonadota bacterium]
MSDGVHHGFFARTRKAATAALAALALSAAVGGGARADDAADWQLLADEVIAIYEGARFDTVSPDFDCQGLSLGAKQLPVSNGSVNRLTQGVPDETLAAGVAAAMPTHGATFLKALRQARDGDTAEARVTLLTLQTTAADAKCAGGRRGTALKPGVAEEIGAWLTSPAVLEAQLAITRRLSDAGLRLATCWARDVADLERPNFTHYLYFYDFIVQNGEGWLRDYELFDIVKKIQFGTQYGETREKEIEKKYLYIKQWLNTDWEIARSRKYWEDAAFNAGVLTEEFEAGRLTEDHIRMIFVRYMRSTLGNNRYSLVSVNRGMINLFGRGRVGVTPRDISAIKARAGDIDLDALPDAAVCARDG